MQALYILLGAVLLIILGLVIFSLFLPSLIRVERSRTIKAPIETLFEQVNDLKNWPTWSPWFGLDPNMQTTFGEKTSGAGAFYRWHSQQKHVGSGSVTINESRPYELITCDIHFEGRGINKSTFRFEPGTPGVKITWTFEMNTGLHPIKKLFGRLMDKYVGPDFEKGLRKIETITTT
ncbi:polyketide cyclase/dehydrase/lipid transport protein [Chitinophaga skermanii]|uniref:Polyketide cyclase/dehydrase/lipid transport protein n=1 Tax=Chitinophaga skermanii TaxID=331697 RepID=A0A327QKW2_9BACT|nr:SRPBCC family protein [Chitinophaga skermanii]RAJ05296.1 polyketide cyclase/dehydrase/lipid transport protein [Chitinophaga skermanii]